jgi:hypothetical protein
MKVSKTAVKPYKIAVNCTGGGTMMNVQLAYIARIKRATYHAIASCLAVSLHLVLVPHLSEEGGGDLKQDIDNCNN